MDIKAYFASKLSQVLFLSVKKDRFTQLFKHSVEEEVYLPIKPSQMMKKAEKGEDLENIPLAFFIEGMFYVLGADPAFSFNEIYKRVVNEDTYTSFIKGTIFKEMERGNEEEAYILLKGLLSIKEEIEIFDKILIVVDHLRIKDEMYLQEESDLIERAKKMETYALPYLYESGIQKEKKDFGKALTSIEQYFEYGGKETEELAEWRISLKKMVQYEQGKERIYENPVKALELLLPLLEEFEEDAPLQYYIAVAYRILERHEDAIYYLNEALAIDSALVEVVNELGINYASLGEYPVAISYLRKAFEATKSIEICTNLIMCYINEGDVEQAKLHLEIAEKIDSKDEVVVQLQSLLKK